MRKNFDSVLDILGYGQWSGGRYVDNTVFENKGMVFKGGIPVNDKTIQERIGVRTRVVAPENERIGKIALRDLLRLPRVEPSKIKLIISATNVGEDKNDPKPSVRFAVNSLQGLPSEAIAFDLYAGCPGFNVSAELVLMMSLAGFLDPEDISVVIAAENPFRARAFKDTDTANIIFGDDAMAAALETTHTGDPDGGYHLDKIEGQLPSPENEPRQIARRAAKLIFQVAKTLPLDGIIVDNHLPTLDFRVPAIAARIQDALARVCFPEKANEGTFDRFKDAMAFYEKNIRSFAFDIKTVNQEPSLVEKIGKAYALSGKYSTIATVFIDPAGKAVIAIHRGEKSAFPAIRNGIIDTQTRTHGCFGDFIHGARRDGEIYGRMDGKGVFMYATRGAKAHLSDLLERNGLSLNDIDLLIEHQANFAMLPLTLRQLLEGTCPDTDQAVREFLANKMVTNIHERGNCSVVCMLRLAHDLYQGALRPNTVGGYEINRNLENLKNARLILHDSVGAGMTRSSFLLRRISDSI